MRQAVSVPPYEYVFFDGRDLMVARRGAQSGRFHGPPCREPKRPLPSGAGTSWTNYFVPTALRSGARRTGTLSDPPTLKRRSRKPLSPSSASTKASPAGTLCAGCWSFSSERLGP
jgi:hypothetical protein